MGENKNKKSSTASIKMAIKSKKNLEIYEHFRTAYWDMWLKWLVLFRNNPGFILHCFDLSRYDQHVCFEKSSQIFHCWIDYSLRDSQFTMNYVITDKENTIHDSYATRYIERYDTVLGDVLKALNELPF